MTCLDRHEPPCDYCADRLECIACNEPMCVDGPEPAITCDNHAGRCVDCQRDALGCSACDETVRLEVAS